MQRTAYAHIMLRWLGYTATENLERNLVTGQTCWQVTARGDEHVIIARAVTQAAAWFEACRMGEWLQSEE